MLYGLGLGVATVHNRFYAKHRSRRCREVQREVVLCGDVSMNNPAFSEVSFLARCIAAYACGWCMRFIGRELK